MNRISAFIDDEGYIDKDKCRIIINSTNYHGLMDIKMMLEHIGVDSKIYNYSKKWGFYRLIIHK